MRKRWVWMARCRLKWRGRRTKLRRLRLLLVILTIPLRVTMRLFLIIRRSWLVVKSLPSPLIAFGKSIVVMFGVRIRSPLVSRRVRCRTRRGTRMRIRTMLWPTLGRTILLSGCPASLRFSRMKVLLGRGGGRLRIRNRLVARLKRKLRRLTALFLYRFGAFTSFRIG